MKPRGMVLLAALIFLFVIFAAIMVLARTTQSRMSAERVAAKREEALRSAEDLLEQARVALNDGKLQPGGEFRIDSRKVLCSRTARGVKLESFSNAGAAMAGSMPMDRGVRLVWEMVNAPEEGKNVWRRSGWNAKDEIVPHE